MRSGTAKQVVVYTVTLLLLSSFTGCAVKKPQPVTVLRMGYFANITHAQALIGVARGDFAKALGHIKLETMVFNAGPSVVEAMFANQLDCSFIGPSPAINGFIKSSGKAFKIVSGASANGVVIVAARGSGIEKMSDLAGKRIATPQFGNTQDISARIYVSKVLEGKIGEGKDETRIIPIPNSEQITVFGKQEIDASWVPEPWGARCVNEAGAVIIAEEKDLWPDSLFATTVLIFSASFIEKHPEIVQNMVETLAGITKWINENKTDAAELVNQQLLALSGKNLKPDILFQAFNRVRFTSDPLPKSIETFAQWAFEAGILKTAPDITGLIDKRFIDKAMIK